MLEHHAHLVTAQLDQFLRRRLHEILAVEDDLAGGRIVEPGDGADQGRLAGAGQPHDDQDLAGLRHRRRHRGPRRCSPRRAKCSACGRAVVARQKAGRIGPEDLPEIAAGDLGSWLSSSVSRSRNAATGRDRLAASGRCSPSRPVSSSQPAFQVASLSAIHFLAASSGVMPSTSTMAAAAAICGLVKLTFFRKAAAAGHFFSRLRGAGLLQIALGRRAAVIDRVRVHAPFGIGPAGRLRKSGTRRTGPRTSPR